MLTRKFEPVSEDHTLEDLLRRNAALLEQLIRQRADWRLVLRNGVLAGLGGVLGATLVVGILVEVLKPFERFNSLKPYLERIATQLEKK